MGSRGDSHPAAGRGERGEGGLTVDAELGAVPALVEHEEHDGEEEAGEHGQGHGHGHLGTAGRGLGVLLRSRVPSPSPWGSRWPRARWGN